MSRKTSSEQISRKKRNTDSTTERKNSTKKLKNSLLQISKNSEQLGDIDSLKIVKGRRSLKDIDNKIKNLKSELQFLVGDTIKTENVDESKDEMENVASPSFEFSKRNFDNNDSFLGDSGFSVSGSCSKTKPSESRSKTNSPDLFSSPGPSFSKWLDSPDNSKDSEVRPKRSKLLNPFTTVNPEEISRKHSTTHKEAAKLLYKSFVLQNLQKYSSSSDESEVEFHKTSKNSNKRKAKSRASKRIKSSQKKNSKRVSGKKGKKRRIKYDSESDIEVIDLEPCSLRRSTRNKNVEIDFDVQNLNWDEPFCLEENTETCSSDLEIIETPADKPHVAPKRKKSLVEKQQQQPQEGSIDLNISRTSDFGNGGKRRSWECPICFEQSVGQEIVTTLCGHVFCKRCIEKCDSSKKRTCPSCRTDITDKPLITLFNF